MADYTLYMLEIGQVDNIQLMINTYLLTQHLILQSDSVRFGGWPFHKQIQWI